MIGLLVAGVAGQLLAGRVDGNVAVLLAVASLAGLIAFSIANLHLTGMGVMIVGLGLNLFAIMANGGMPVSARALVVADIVPAADVKSVELRGARHLERSTDSMKVLGDIIPMGRQAVSFGDLIIAVATIDVIAHLVRRQRRPQRSISRREPRPGLGDRSEPGAVVAVPVLGEPRHRRTAHARVGDVGPRQPQQVGQLRPHRAAPVAASVE